MNIFQIAKALGGDDLTSPTIPFTVPVGSITPVPSGISGPSIILSTNIVTLKKDDTAKIEVTIFTDRKEVNSYKFSIKFNSSILKVIDADPNTAGTQIAYSDTFFDKKTNIVSDTGLISFEAVAPDKGVSSITNSVRASFNVQAIQDGASLIELVKADSALVDSTGSNILNSVNSVSINVSSQTVSQTPTPSVITPKTGLLDDLGYSNAIIIGALLIITGIYLFKKKDNDDLRWRASLHEYYH